MSQSNQPSLNVISLLPGQPQSNLTSLLAVNGTRCYVPSKGLFYTYHMDSVSVPDGQGTVAGSGGGNWLSDQSSATSSAGTITSAAAGISAYNYYATADSGFSGGTSASRFDNQVPIQAAINAAIADPGHRGVMIQRDPAGTFLNTNAPIEIMGAGPLYLSGENETIVIRPIGYYGPGIIAGPFVTAPTSLDGASGWWGVSLNSNNWLPLWEAGTVTLQGLTAFCVELDLKSPLGTAGVVMGSSGQRGFSEAATTAFSLTINSDNSISVVITTSISGQQTYNSSAKLGNNARTNVEIDFDQTTAAVWVYIGGVYDGHLTLSAGETMVQGYEDFIFGGIGVQWPQMTGRSNVAAPNAVAYSLRLNNIARHSSTSNFTPATSERTIIDNSIMLLLNFDPVYNGTAATSNAGMIKGAAQMNLLGIQGAVYLPWQTFSVAQQAGVIIQNLTVQCVGNTGIWIQQSPNTKIQHVTINGSGPLGLALFGNCYLSILNDVAISMSSTNGSMHCQNGMGLWYMAGGNNHFSDLTITGPDVCAALANCAAQLDGLNYMLPGGKIGILIKADGTDPPVLINQCFMGDEGRNLTDCGIFIAGRAGPTSSGSTVTLTQGSTSVVGTLTQWAHPGGPLPGTQYNFANQIDLTYRVDHVVDDTHLVLTVPYTGSSGTMLANVPRGGVSGLHVRFNGGTPQVLSSGVPIFKIDGATCIQIDCETWNAIANSNVVCFFLKDADDGVYILGTQDTVSSAGAQTEWMPSTGSSGQGRLYVTSLRQGRLHKYPCPNTDFTVPPFDFLNSTISPVGVLTATRTHTLPLISGYEWTIDNSFQTGTPQSVTYKCLSDPGSGVTVAAGKRAKVACYDTGIGLVRITPDT